MERRRKRVYFKSKGVVPKKPKSRTGAESGSIDGLGRLISSRKLSPGQEYQAFQIPTYRPGRSTGRSMSTGVVSKKRIAARKKRVKK